MPATIRRRPPAGTGLAAARTMIGSALFAHPRGRLGELAGRLMALENRELNRRVVELLALRPDDVVLEVGFGPGVGLRLAAAALTSGWVGGVDPSPAMERLARRRNRGAIAAGRIELRRAAAERLPWPPETFSKAFSVNTFHEWSDILAGLSEIRRVLFPGGTLVLATRARWLRSDRELAALAELYRGTLEDAGFSPVAAHPLRSGGRRALALEARVGTSGPS